MRCPWCKAELDGHVHPMKHMVQCQTEEAATWQRRFDEFMTYLAFERALRIERGEEVPDA